MALGLPGQWVWDSAARRLIAHLEGKPTEGLPKQLWAGELVVRETTGPVSS